MGIERRTFHFGRLPQPMEELFNIPRPVYLSLRGQTGSGKTQLSSQYTSSRYDKFADAVYFSTEKDPNWIIENNQQIAKKAGYEKLFRPEAVDTQLYDKLIGIKNMGASLSALREHIKKKDKELKEIQARDIAPRVKEHPDRYPEFYREAILAETPPGLRFVAIDSLQALSRYEIEYDGNPTAQKGVISATNTIINYLNDKDNGLAISALITDQIDHKSNADTVTNGIVILGDRRVEDEVSKSRKLVRELEIRKIENINRTRDIYAYTLADGIFRALPETKLQYPRAPSVIDNPRPLATHYNQKKQALSTGSETLDMEIEGGFPRGSWNVIEVGDSVSSHEVNAIFYSNMGANALNTGCGFFAIPFGSNALDTYIQLSPFVRKDVIINDHVKEVGNLGIVEIEKETKQPDVDLLNESEASIERKEDYPWLISLKGMGKESMLQHDFDAFTKRQKYFHEKTTETEPVAYVAVGYDTVESAWTADVWGPQVRRSIEMTKNWGDVRLNFVPESSPMLKPLLRTGADSHWKLDKIDDVLVFYGKRPTTSRYLAFYDILDQNKFDIEWVPIL